MVKVLQILILFLDSNSRSAQQRHVHNIFVQAANRQHIQKSKLQSRIKSHFVDGRRIEEEIPSKSSSSSINSPSTKQRRVGQPPTLQNIVLNNVKSALNKVTVTAGKATVTSRPLSSNFQVCFVILWLNATLLFLASTNCQTGQLQSTSPATQQRTQISFKVFSDARSEQPQTLHE